MYALHCSLAVAIPAIQPRLRLSRTNRLRFALPGGQRTKHRSELVGLIKKATFPLVNFTGAPRLTLGITGGVPATRSGNDSFPSAAGTAVNHAAAAREPSPPTGIAGVNCDFSMPRRHAVDTIFTVSSCPPGRPAPMRGRFGNAS
jgi:hypothetical protein